jgi:septal ring factor EnvC (AmiA/AmiB activator)
MATGTKAIAVLVLVGGLVASHWIAYQAGDDYGRNAVTLAQRNKDIANLNEARNQEQKHQAQLELALKEANDRENRYRADAASARLSVGRLRNTVTDIQRSIPGLTTEAVRQYADTASVVFKDCADRYSALAEQADRIDSDRQTLEQAWPK